MLFSGGRSLYGEQETPRDWISEPMTLRRGVAGAKPFAVALWAFSLVGAQPGDELDDLFPGSGAITEAWLRFERERPLPFPAGEPTEPLWEPPGG